MSGWGISGPDRHATQIEKALRNGETTQSKSNTRVLFEGKAEQILSFEGSRRIATGRLSFWHWRSQVLAIDFDRDMVTDFGYTGFSHSTTANIGGWLSTLISIKFLGMRSLSGDVWAPTWTSTRRDDDLHAKFHAGAPWVKQIDGVPWFHGPSYDAEIAESGRYLTAQLCDGINWRWFTADWVNGRWTKRFIDKNAEAKWNARNARLEKRKKAA
jgi:hypothetical protein